MEEIISSILSEENEFVNSNLNNSFNLNCHFKSLLKSSSRVAVKTNPNPNVLKFNFRHQQMIFYLINSIKKKWSWFWNKRKHLENYMNQRIIFSRMR